jgi:hypothetical protein
MYLCVRISILSLSTIFLLELFFPILLLTLSGKVIRYHYSSSPAVYLSNNKSGLKNANFVDTVLQDLLHRDLVHRCPHDDKLG